MSELPQGWAETSLGDLLIKTSSVDPRRFPDERFHLYSVPSYTAYRPESVLGLEIGSTKQEVSEGDVLLCKIVPHIRRGWTVPATGLYRQIASGEWIVLRPHSHEPEYIRRFILSDQFHVQFMRTIAGVGGSLTRARPVEAAKIKLPFAPLPEQRRIVAKIDSLTGRSRRARDHLDHIPRLVEQYKQAILAAAFRGDLTREWRKMNELSEPQGIRLPELLAKPIRNGLSVRGTDTPPGIRALRLSALHGGRVDLSNVRFLPITEDRSERFLLCEGDILVSRGNGTKKFVGLAAVVGAVKAPTIFPDTAFRLHLKPSIASPSWLALIWNAPQMREQIERAAKTTAGIWKISQKDLNQIDILLPVRSEQQEIVRRIETAFAWIDRLAADSTSARKLIDHLDQAILAKAFRGELVPQDPNDEPASVLLDRIRAEREAAPKTRRGRKKTA